MTYDVVIPTIGRPSLGHLLASLARARGPLPDNVFVVDDRRAPGAPLALGELGELRERVHVIAGSGSGPAAARNAGWRRAHAPWIAFLDDDVVVDGAWREDLVADLEHCAPDVAGSQGRISVPMPPHRRPTDWERNVGALESARWITADCAYRRDDLQSVGGFDERFTRAYREDADLGLRLSARNRAITLGRRRAQHPVRSADAWISVRVQAGNADDALMDALHGKDWRERAGSPRGRFRRHAFTVTCACAALAFGAVWAASTARFAWQRIAPGPRDAREIGTMLATSIVIPFAAVTARIRGTLRAGRIVGGSRRAGTRPSAVLFDRDGTLIVDEPALRDPARVRLLPGARAALDRLREAGIVVGVVTNQGAVGDGRVRAPELAAVHARLAELAGPLATIEACIHHPDAGCDCRKPQPGLVLAAAQRLGAQPRDCVVVGDIGSDIAAAQAAGARAILVPTPLTLPAEIQAAPHVARDLSDAVDRILAGRA